MSHENTIELISLALDASLMRQTAIANNVANANTADYQTQTVNFEQQLMNASPNLEADNEGALKDIKPFYELAPTQSSIDEQMALSVQNATQFRALVKGLNLKFSIMKLALQGNNQS